MRNLYIQQLDVIGVNNIFLMQWNMSGDVTAVSTKETLKQLTERLQKIDTENVRVTKGTPVPISIYKGEG